METLDAIQTRRSIRKFTDKAVSDQLIEKILRSGMTAPSAANQQPWHFIVIRDKKILNSFPAVHKYTKMCATADAAILVCADTTDTEFKCFWQQDCAACTQNMLLAIHDLGLGAVWVGVYPREEYIKSFTEMFNLPKNIVPFSLIPLGYPDQKIGKVERYDTSRIHKEKW